jgi:hypothetical protein
MIPNIMDQSVSKVFEVRKPAIIYIWYKEDALGEEQADEDQNRTNVNCCMSKRLSCEQDFREEKPKLQQVIEELGHKCLFLPAFHCELNPIELYWGYVKKQFRDQCDGKFVTAKILATRLLNDVSVQVIRNFFRKIYRYQDAYSKGLNAKQAEFAVKKYRSHRKIPNTIMSELAVAGLI